MLRTEMMTVWPEEQQQQQQQQQQGQNKEKRQVFLRSYQFSRKRSAIDRFRHSLIRVKRVIWVRLCAVRKLRRLLWFRCCWSGRTRFHRLVIHHRPSTTTCF